MPERGSMLARGRAWAACRTSVGAFVGRAFRASAGARLRAGARLPTSAAFSAAAAVGAMVLLLGTLEWKPPPVLLWNASASSPMGLYAVGRGALRVGDMAVAWPPPNARRLAGRRHYLPASVPLVKRVAAVAGDRVCAQGRIVSVDGRQVAFRKPRDPSGRRLPWWSGCRLLRPGEAFLLSPVGPTAFDGRYFGVTRRSEVVGRATLLWASRARAGKHG